jgi:hypothetical protein
MRFSSRLTSDEITTHVYRALTSAMSTTVMVVKLAITSDLGSSLDLMVIGWYWEWNGWTWFWCSFVEPCDPLCPFVPLCGSYFVI